MTTWIVEDEVKLAEFLKSDLRHEGFLTELSSSYDEVKSVVAKKPFQPDLLVLDRLLNQLDSIELIPEIRGAFPNVKILVLSAINTANERAVALDRGADDYMGKPYSGTELLARLRALARRPTLVSTSNHLSCGNLVLDSITRVAAVGDRRLNLPNKEFLLLRILVQSPGRVFNKAALFEQIWDVSPDVETNVVEATVTNLRRKLEEASANIRIKNMRKVGYWIEA